MLPMAAFSQDRSHARSMVISDRGIVATSQTLASQAGAQVLARGGSAMDAAIAANAVLGVVEPESCGLGGDLFAIYWDAKTGKLTAINASGWAPKALTIDVLKGLGNKTMPQEGIQSVTVPGCVDGWSKLHKKFGKLPWNQLFQPAIYYAANGFPVTEIIGEAWRLQEKKLAADENAKRVFLSNGSAPKVGQVFHNPGLASALKLVAAEGPAAFYRGAIAKAILKTSDRLGGKFALADLSEFESEWVEIDPNKASCEDVPGKPAEIRGDTIYLSVVDREGNIVSLIQSLYQHFGSAVVVDDYGFPLQDRGGLFELDPQHANALAPRKRPFHTIIPAFMEKDDVHIGFGIMGGLNQPQAHVQFVSNMVDHGMNIQAALEAPRFTKKTFGGCDVLVESRITKEVRDGLTAKGHQLTLQGDFSSEMGGGQAVIFDAKTGVKYGASSPRKDGAAIPEPHPYFGK